LQHAAIPVSRPWPLPAAKNAQWLPAQGARTTRPWRSRTKTSRGARSKRPIFQ